MEEVKPKEEMVSVSSKKSGGGGIWTSIKLAIIVLTTTVAVLLALRNTITYHLQHFWGASGDFWQHQWNKVLDLHGNDPFNLFVYGPTMTSYIIYWGAGAVYIFMDLTNFPRFIRPYKVQPGTNEPVSPRLVLKCFLLVTFNQLVIGMAVAFLGYYVSNARGYDRSTQLPTFHWVLYEIALCILIEEVGFYYAHRLFHHRIMYKRFHKIHHEWQSPIAITAVYAHPLEHILANMVPVATGPIILGSHPATMLLWFSLATLSTITVHSGYHLPFFISSEFHDYHHLKFTECFGVLGILDHLHGTDQKFRSSECYTRHTTTLTFIPPRQLYPDLSPKGKDIKGKEC